MCTGLLFAGCMGMQQNRVEETPAEEQQAIIRGLLPLPHEIRVLGKVRVSRRHVRLVVDQDAHPLVRAACAEFWAATQSTEARTGRPIADSSFTIRFGLRSDEAVAGVPGIPEMADLPNAEQAYAIVPIHSQDNTVSGCALVGQGAPGAYYAMKTFLQLVKPGDRMVVPIVAIRDWPDLAERGFWGSYAAKDIACLADRKFNLIEAHTRRRVTDDGLYVGMVDPALLALTQRHAIKLVPIMTHQGHWPDELFDRIPQLRAKGDKATVGKLHAACHAQPEFQEVLNAWMLSLADPEGVGAVSAWLSECVNFPHCSCPECSKENWFVSETRALLSAWREAKKTKPELQLRILLTQGSYEHNELVLKALPPEVGVIYYCGIRTYSVVRKPMIYPLLHDFAKNGRWLGVCPQLIAVWKYNTPFPCVPFIHARMNEFVDAGLRTLCGRLHPAEWPYYPLSLDAAAEFSWNAKGRSKHEFALAWATREGFREPETFAQWCDTIGPVAWDVYEGGVPMKLRKAVTALQKGEVIRLGEGVLEGFDTAEQFDLDQEACKRAAMLAAGTDSATSVAETQVVSAYVSLLKSIHEISEQTAGRKQLESDALSALQRTTNEFAASESLLCTGLEKWFADVERERQGRGFRKDSTIMAVEENCAKIAVFLEGFGVQDSGRPYRSQMVGAWEDEDFADSGRIRKTWEVTEHIDGSGDYEARFRYTSGHWGLQIHRVALMGGPDSDLLRELAVDEHQGNTGHRSKANGYRLALDGNDEALRYFIAADITGRADGGCVGKLFIRKLPPEDRDK